METIVLLSHKSSDSYTNMKIEFGEGEGKVLLDNITEVKRFFGNERMYISNCKTDKSVKSKSI